MYCTCRKYPEYTSGDMYERIMERLQGKEIRIAVDATKDLLVNVLKYHPFLIKPNNHELGEIFGKVLESEADIVGMQKTSRRWEQSMFSYRWQGTVRSW